jgi:signal transduction histidine kinase
MKRRLLLSYLSITAFVLLVLEIPFGVSYGNSVQRRLTSDIQHDAFALAIRAQEPIDTAATSATSRSELQALADDYRKDAGGRVVIVDPNGVAIADSDRTRASDPLLDFSAQPEIMDALSGAEASGIRSSHSVVVNELLYVALPVGSAQGIRGAIRITYPASVVDDRIRHIWLLLAATGGVVLGIVFLASLLLARSITRPLAELERAGEALGSGDLAVRAEVPKGPDEVRVLAESFNATAARLEQLVGAQRAFVADASHQLRTPLAALRLRLENLEADVSGHAAEDLDGALAEVRRLSRLVDGLLALTRAEQSTTAPTSISVDELLDGRTDAWDAFAAERNVRIESSVRRAHYVRATPGRLEQVVDNLLNNALEVAPEGSAVRLAALDRGNWVELRVSDEGPGMSDEERARAFDRFWQSAPARRDGRPNGHFGLGLAIVRELVVADGGEVQLEPSSSGGLEVIVRMRRAERAGEPRDPPRVRQFSTTSG